MITLQQEEQTSSFMVVADEEEVQMMVRISACTTSFSLSNSHPSFFAGDRRGKRRRSPSPGGRGGADTYIPSYHRDRSPPYRERGGSGESAPSLPSFLLAVSLRGARLARWSATDENHILPSPTDRYGGRDAFDASSQGGYDRRGPPPPYVWAAS